MPNNFTEISTGGQANVERINAPMRQLDEAIGPLSSLQTANTGKVVDAVNEIKNIVDNVEATASGVVSSTIDGAVALGAASFVLDSVDGFVESAYIVYPRSDGTPERRQIDSINIGTKTITLDAVTTTTIADGELVSMITLEQYLSAGDYNTQSARLDGIDKLPGALRLAADVAIGATSATLHSGGDLKIGMWIALSPFSANCEVKQIQSMSGKTAGISATVAAHSKDSALIWWIDEPNFSVRLFGAVVDGATDDTLSVQAAATAAGLFGGVLLFDIGTCRIDKINISADTTVAGYGPNSIVKAIDSTASGSIFNVQGDGVIFENMAVDGNRGNISLTHHAILIDNASSSIGWLKVRDVEFSDMENWCIAKSGDEEIHDVEVYGCRVSTGKKFVNLPLEKLKDISVHHNHITSMDSTPINLGINITVSANQEFAERFTVSDNHIVGVSDTGTETHAIICYGQHIVISRNHIEDISNTPNTDCEGIYTKGRNVVIEANTLINAGKQDGAIMLKGRPRDLDGTINHTSYGNIVANNTIRATVSGSWGIGIYSDDCIVTNNVIEGTERGIHVSEDGVAGVKIINNTIVESVGAYAIYVRFGGADIQVNDNYIRGMPTGITTYGIFLEGRDASAVGNVRIESNEIVDVNGTSGAAIRLYANTGPVDSAFIRANRMKSCIRGVVSSAESGQTVSNINVYDNIFDSITNEEITGVSDADGYAIAGNPGYSPATIAFVDGDTTPSVKNRDGLYNAPNTSATTITDFDDGANGQTIHVAMNGNTTLDHHPDRIRLKSGADETPPANTTKSFIRLEDKWREI